jgi:hypothetical protein
MNLEKECDRVSPQIFFYIHLYSVFQVLELVFEHCLRQLHPLKIKINY